MNKTKTDVVKEIRNGIDHNTLINYLMNYDFTEAEIREFWDKTTEWNWFNYQGKNMSEDFKREMASTDSYTNLIATENDYKNKVLTYDWTKASKNKWNKFKSFVKKDLMWGAYKLRGSNDYKTYVEVYVDNYNSVNFKDSTSFEEGMNSMHKRTIEAYRQLADWLNI